MRSTLLLATFSGVVVFVSAFPSARQINGTILDPAIASGLGVQFGMVGCYLDSQNPSLLSFKANITDVTIEGCLGMCTTRNYNVAGIENGGATCWCDTQFEYITPMVDQSKCEQLCQGTHEFCGGPNYMLVYERDH